MQRLKHLGQFKNLVIWTWESCGPPPVVSAVDWAIHNSLVLCESRELHRIKQDSYWWSWGLRASHQDISLA